MKSMISAACCALIVLAVASSARADSNGYLLLKIEKFSYSSSWNPRKSTQSAEKQKYKILLDSNFLSQFKNQPSPISTATEFYCQMSDESSISATGMSFTQWFAPKPGGKVATWFWGEGSESLGGKVIDAHNAKAQVNISFPSWQTLDSSEMISFDNDQAENINGLNISVAAQYVPIGDASLQGALLAPVNAVDGSTLVAGDPQTGLALTARCAFQKN